MDKIKKGLLHMIRYYGKLAFGEMRAFKIATENYSYPHRNYRAIRQMFITTGEYYTYYADTKALLRQYKKFLNETVVKGIIRDIKRGRIL